MEAFAVAASVLQVATVGLALARVLYSLCDEAPSGNSHVENLAFSVKSTSSVLEDIGKVFRREENWTTVDFVECDLHGKGSYKKMHRRIRNPSKHPLRYTAECVWPRQVHPEDFS
jgi:hypothetical protein